jgi:5-methylcytosine-specific restriction endonuclease McrA
MGRHIHFNKVGMKPYQRKVWLEVIARDYQACVRCGAPGSEVHHILGRGICWEDDLWAAPNMAVLCKKCHDDMMHTVNGRGELLRRIVDRNPAYLDWYAERRAFWWRLEEDA